jgi:hypothetical protein
MAVPKTSMNKHSKPVPRKYKIWLARQVLSVKTVPKAQSVSRVANSHLRRRVTRADAGHHFTSPSMIDDIHYTHRVESSPPALALLPRFLRLCLPDRRFVCQPLHTTIQARTSRQYFHRNTRGCESLTYWRNLHKFLLGSLQHMFVVCLTRIPQSTKATIVMPSPLSCKAELAKC